ncbi:hypothetical protein HR45_11555 [Shewanella mangrovi]|uniref:Uncharacterized protein n=1 Tax=Shewanella mangrovi TaxID=1515746 RepID=A0A094LQ84_9GAMM|nr:hypothetical protein [Shewanella mangrovi]KFZ37298.1 hypothetical protein HR45_11555 [Shewanella mangrovi]
MEKLAKLWPAIFPLSLLSVPFISSQVTNGVVWSYGDFIVAAVLLGGTASCYQWISHRAGNHFPYRVATALAMVASLLLVWANLAVGLMNTPADDHNLFFFSVIMVGVIGTLWSQRRPRGMSFTMLAMAAVLFAITVGLSIHIMPLSAVTLSPQQQFSVVFCLSIVALYLLAAWLFHRATFLLH